LAACSEEEVKEHINKASSLSILFANLGTEPFAFLKAKSSQTWFREQTPQKQREIKQELELCLQQLHEAQLDKAEQDIKFSGSTKKMSMYKERGDSLLEQQKAVENAGKNNAFAFQQNA